MHPIAHGICFRCPFAPFQHIWRNTMKAIFTILISALTLMTSGAAHAQIVLNPGQSQTITCSNAGGGGGGSNLTCVQELSDWCYHNTSQNRDQCYEQASRYCPSTTFSGCVSQTADYCYHNTSMNRDQCFQSALGTCRGNPVDVRNLLHQVMEAGRLIEKGVDPTSMKSQEPAKVDAK